MRRIVKPIFLNCKPGELCCKSYVNHKKGCPNFGLKEGCPPNAKMLDLIFDFSELIFIIWNIFDFESHIKKMKARHSNWSERQLACCLYWQGTARKDLNKRIGFFEFEYPDYHIIRCPEANGINITKTMAQVGEILEWPPQTKTYQVALAGKLLEGKNG